MQNATSRCVTDALYIYILLVEPAAFRDITYDDNHTQYKLTTSKDNGWLTYCTNYTIKVAEAA